MWWSKYCTVLGGLRSTCTSSVPKKATRAIVPAVSVLEISAHGAWTRHCIPKKAHEQHAKCLKEPVIINNKGISLKMTEKKQLLLVPHIYIKLF